MSQNFKDKEAQKIFERQRSRQLPPESQQVALGKWRMLNRAQTLQDLRVPLANRLERLRYNKVGFRLHFTTLSSKAKEGFLINFIVGA